jgi:hypothetical protein
MMLRIRKDNNSGLMSTVGYSIPSIICQIWLGKKIKAGPPNDTGPIRIPEANASCLILDANPPSYKATGRN